MQLGPGGLALASKRDFAAERVSVTWQGEGGLFGGWVHMVAGEERSLDSAGSPWQASVALQQRG